MSKQNDAATAALNAETETENKSSMTQVREAFPPVTAPSFVPTNREQLDMIIEMEALQKQIDNLGIKTTKPTLLCDSGIVFDIVDAYDTEIRDGEELKPVVVMELVEQETGIAHIVMQSANSMRQLISRRFGMFKATGASRAALVLRGYRFVESEKYGRAGNMAIVLQKA